MNTPRHGWRRRDRSHAGGYKEWFPATSLDGRIRSLISRFDGHVWTTHFR